ncbi:nicotinate phosphoribosyltransferase [Bacilli bacterium PM5-3]|nr:nicotinate phosphoribosyltransferase [Bacilli bacterium PM5-3]MDH6603819.1 nicotinate phosphoribosyltransferase [Bacilli bacterium PM5-9]
MSSLALHTDFYEINMAYSFFNDNIHEKKSVFEIYFRKMPFDNGYAVFAGLQRVIEYIERFQFSESDIEYLKKFDYSLEFLEYLKNLKFTGTIKSAVEGEVVFADEPLMIIEADLIQAQLIETALLNIVNFQTLIATKASRIRNLATNQLLFEFGARRAQEMDAALWGTRAAYISGFDGTSLVEAGQLFDIPLVGTHAHSFVQVYQDELTAFRKYAQSHKKCTFLVDTYDTLKSGVPNAIKVAKELENTSSTFEGIRIDSGDLSYHSKEARRMLDEAGFKDAKITVSNDLDEDTIASLILEGAKIDCFGIGTKLITSYNQPALGAVYKLVAIEENDKLKEVIKISNNIEKITNPGLKQVYRIISKETNKAEGDYMALAYEEVENTNELNMYNEQNPFVYKVVKDYDLYNIHKVIYDNGKLIYELPKINEIREYHKKTLSLLWDEHKRYRYPARYYVNFSLELYTTKHNLINKYKK